MHLYRKGCAKRDSWAGKWPQVAAQQRSTADRAARTLTARTYRTVGTRRSTRSVWAEKEAGSSPLLGLHAEPARVDGVLLHAQSFTIFFHVDAAFGGFVLPFLQKLGYQIPEWDFSVKNVNSITADPHKMGLGIIPTGGLLLRDRSILNRIGFEIPYLAGENKKHFHIIGTRPGGTVIAFWAILKHLGINGFERIIKDCMENTYYLRYRITEIDGIKLATEPLMNIVGLTLENGDNISKLEEELRKRNWMLGKFINFNLIRIVLMPHIKQEHLSDFIDDLEEILRKLKIT